MIFISYILNRKQKDKVWFKLYQKIQTILFNVDLAQFMLLKVITCYHLRGTCPMLNPWKSAILPGSDNDIGLGSTAVSTWLSILCC